MRARAGVDARVRTAGMKQVAIKLLVSLAALLLFLGMAELAARLFLPPPQRVATAARALAPPQVGQAKEISAIATQPDEGGLYRSTPTGRRLAPNRIVTIDSHRLSKKRVVIETNSLGYRNPEIGAKHGERILFLGDSVTFQDFLNEDETFVRLIARKARADNRDWETINTGVGSISLKTELAILLETGLALQPDVVVVDFYLNDFQESRGVHVVHLPPLLAHSWFLYHVAAALNTLRAHDDAADAGFEKVDLPAWRKEFVGRVPQGAGFFNENPAAFNAMIAANFRDFGAAWSAGAWDHIRPLLAELQRLSLEHHFKLVVVGFPIYQQAYTRFLDDYPQQQLKRLGAELGIPVLDLLPAFRAEVQRLGHPGTYEAQEIIQDLFYDQCHHTPAGSALVAAEIYKFLQQQ